MFLDHIFKRVKKLLGISISSSNENSEKDMIDSAVTYMSSLKKLGTNITGNEYVRIYVLESLVPPTVKSSRSLALRLGSPSAGIGYIAVKSSLRGSGGTYLMLVSRKLAVSPYTAPVLVGDLRTWTMMD